MHLLREESRRIPISFQHIADGWVHKAVIARSDDRFQLLGWRGRTGYVGYAMQQATVYNRLAKAALAEYTAIASIPDPGTEETGDGADIAAEDPNDVAMAGGEGDE